MVMQSADLFLASAILTILILTIGNQWRSPVSVVSAMTLPTLLGLSGLFADFGRLEPRLVPAFFLAPALALGAVTSARAGAARESVERAPQLDARIPTSSVSLFVVTGSALHFVLLGSIPALSDDIETQRFAFNSGLGGLPSRCLLFGLPILAMAQVTHPHHFSRNSTALTWTALILTRVALGFKGGLVEIVFLLLLALLSRGRRLTTRAHILLLTLATLAVSYATLISKSYATLQREQSFVAYVLRRSTVTAAEPGFLSMTSPGFVDRPFALHDLLAYLHRYLGIDTGIAFPVEQIISARLTGTPLLESAFIVPVTVGGPAYLLGSFGPIGLLLAAITLGWIVTALILLARRRPSLLNAVVAAASVLALRDFVLNGNAIYIAVNYGVSVAALLFAFHLLRKPKRSG